MGEEGATGQKLAAEEQYCHEQSVLDEKYTEQELSAKKQEAAEHPRSITTQQAPPLVERIIDGPQPPSGAAGVFAPTGRWIGEVDGVWYVVYAGAEVDPATLAELHSEVRMYRAGANAEGKPLPLLGVYKVPGDSRQALRVTGRTGDSLDLETEAGVKLSFDLAARAFS